VHWLGAFMDCEAAPPELRLRAALALLALDDDRRSVSSGKKAAKAEAASLAARGKFGPGALPRLALVDKKKPTDA
jgi:hypothetical protein